MQIENTKTGVIYRTHTARMGGAFVSFVWKDDNGNQTLSSYEKHLTRSKAYRYVCTVCKTLAANHAFLN